MLDIANTDASPIDAIVQDVTGVDATGGDGALDAVDASADGDERCAPGSVRPCYGGPPTTRGIGRCRAGEQTCEATERWSLVCAREVQPAPSEICGNSIDDDCNGAVDDSCTGTPVQLSLGGTYSLARMSDGTVRAWGLNEYGTLGDGTTTRRSIPQMVPGLRNVTRIAAGLYHACAVTSDGRVHCWGNNQARNLGHISSETCTTDFTACTRTPTAVAGITNAIDVGVGVEHTCAVLADNTVSCWGSNSAGQLGRSTTAVCDSRLGGRMSCSETPAPLAGVSQAVRVAAVREATCMLLRSGSVQCLGGNSTGSLGDGTRMDRTTPVTALGVSDATQIHTHADGVLAQTRDGRVFAWGVIDSLGLGGGPCPVRTGGTVLCTPTPIGVRSIAGAIDTALGFGFICVRLADESVQCMGQNRNGELGDGTTVTRYDIAPVRGLSAVRHVAAGANHACAIVASGQVFCWGTNFVGELGAGTPGPDPVTTPIRAML
ncbi:MAG: hypothetical protein JNK05_06515 [Myxococcales bacterium]|nr:hypothetical protein [Myxococcales bacterium]